MCVNMLEVITTLQQSITNEALKCKPSAHSKFQLCCIADNDEGGSIIIQQYMLQSSSQSGVLDKE